MSNDLMPFAEALGVIRSRISRLDPAEFGEGNDLVVLAVRNAARDVVLEETRKAVELSSRKHLDGLHDHRGKGENAASNDAAGSVGEDVCGDISKLGSGLRRKILFARKSCRFPSNGHSGVYYSSFTECLNVAREGARLLNVPKDPVSRLIAKVDVRGQFLGHLQCGKNARKAGGWERIDQTFGLQVFAKDSKRGQVSWSDLFESIVVGLIPRQVWLKHRGVPAGSGHAKVRDVISSCLHRIEDALDLREVFNRLGDLVPKCDRRCVARVVACQVNRLALAHRPFLKELGECKGRIRHALTIAVKGRDLS